MSALDPLNGVVAWVIMRIHSVLGGFFGPDTGAAWGLSIVILVVAIRILLIPLFVKQVHAQRKMAQHAPHLQELRKKYKNDKQKLNEETMKFYKENGVNPLAGCLPMIPQMIVFYALFSVLRAIADWKLGTPLKYGLTTAAVTSAQHATILGVHLGTSLLFSHKHVPVHVGIVIALTVAISASTTFMTVRQTSKRGLMQTNVDPDNPMAQSQKYMMYIVPFFSLTGLYWQYGLVLYWVTTNVWTLGQQYFMFRNWTTEPAGAASATASATPDSGSSARTASSARATTSARTTTSTRTTPSTQRPASGTSRAPAGTRNAGASARNGSTATRTGTVSNGKASARTGSANGRTSTSGSANGAAAKRSASTGSQPASTANGQTSAASSTPAAAAPATGSNGGEKRSLLRLGRQKPEPAPEPEVPATKVVRTQQARQSKSKRSGKR